MARAHKEEEECARQLVESRPLEIAKRKTTTAVKTAKYMYILFLLFLGFPVTYWNKFHPEDFEENLSLLLCKSHHHYLELIQINKF